MKTKCIAFNRICKETSEVPRVYCVTERARKYIHYICSTEEKANEMREVMDPTHNLLFVQEEYLIDSDTDVSVEEFDLEDSED